YIFILMRCRHSRSTLFPYTTLFRSARGPPRAAARRHPTDVSVRSTARVGFRFSEQRPARLGVPAAGTLGPPDHHAAIGPDRAGADRKSTRLNSSHVANSYAVFCLKK